VYGTLHPDIEDDFIIWRLVQEKVATLTELDTVYSLHDALQLNALLDYWQHAESVEHDKADKASKRK
jgi:hypothetical protein